MAGARQGAKAAAEAFAEAVRRYRAVSKALGRVLAEDAFAGLDTELAEPVDPDALATRQKRRIRTYLGPKALAALRPDPEYAQNGFSRDFVAETVLREEGDIDEARLGALDLTMLLEAEEDPDTRARGAAEALARMAPGADLLAPEGNHQFNLDQSFAALAARSAAAKGAPRRRATEALRRRAEQARIAREEAHPAWTLLTATLAAAGLVTAAPAEAESGRPEPPPEPAAPTVHEKESIMADHSNDPCCDRIVDALSRLQEGPGGFAGAGAGTGSLPGTAFGAVLEQQIYASIGLPSLTSDTAFGTGRASLSAKLITGLGRAILRSQDGEIVSYVFHPARARAVAPLDGGEAQGAQAVVAEAAANLKPAILRATYTLRPEVCTCSEEEIEDIKGDIAAGLDALLRELNAQTGVFGLWALTLLARIVRDGASLIALYGIGIPAPSRFDACNATLRTYALAETPWPFRDSVGEIDCDIGILDREANEQAAATFFEHLASLADLIADLITRSQGATLARLRAQVEAIPPAVMDARAALARAGVSETDLKATFFQSGDGENAPSIVKSIELGRLFGWIESAANAWRAELIEDALTIRDLRWIRDTLAVQVAALRGEALDASGGRVPATEGFPEINPNRYALGLRQITELARRLSDALALAKHLHAAASQSLTDRRAPSRSMIFAAS